MHVHFQSITVCEEEEKEKEEGKSKVVLRFYKWPYARTLAKYTLYLWERNVRAGCESGMWEGGGEDVEIL